MTETLQFFYNSGLPQRQRRTRDNRPSSVNRDVPSFLVYPDGSHALGVISPSSGAGGAGVGGVGDDPLGQESAIQGPFVVWADPAPGPAQRDPWSFPALGFHLAALADVVLVVLVLASDASAKRQGGDIRTDAPAMGLPLVSFSAGVALKAVGAWGVHRERIRYLSIFIACSLFLAILSFLWIDKLTHLLIVALDIMLIAMAFSIRSTLSGQWFSARISGHN